MDAGIIKLVVGVLGGVCLICVGGIIVLSALGKPESDALKITLSVGVGGLVGILASQRNQGPPAPPTTTTTGAST